MAKQKASPSWREITDLFDGVLALLPKDRFLRIVLEGSLKVARDKGNPIRGNLLASGLREAIGHVLHSLAPDDDIRLCSWFKQDPGTNGITRRQRANYVVQAGLPDAFVKDTLQIDVKAFVTPILEAMDGLHKATHVRPETVVDDATAVKTMAQDVLLGLHTLLEAAAASRDEMKHAVADVMHHAVFDNLISKTIQEIDELSTHTSVDGHYIESVKVKKMSAVQIDYVITGQVQVELQYGSASDIRDDIGFRQNDSYPYRAKVTSNAAEPMKISSNDIELKVDNNSFYE